MKKVQKYGWKPDLPDYRDMLLDHSALMVTPLPKSVDLSVKPFMPPVWDQGQLGSCTAHGIGAAVEFCQRQNKIKNDFMPSRLFIYYNERVIEGTVKQDAGAEIRDGFKAINAKGVCREDFCPYDITKFTKKPSAIAYKNALLHKAVVYKYVEQNEVAIKTVLASGSPVVIGFTVYESFESESVAKTGVVNLPTKSEAVAGGHCVLCVGYDDTTKRFLMRNSWGVDWGMKGYFTFPYDYLTNPKLSGDFWMVSTLT